MKISKKHIVIDGVKFTYFKKGRGKAFFIVPALHANFDRFKAVFDYLADHFTVYIPELPGIGSKETLNSHAHTAENYAYFLNKMIGRLKLKKYYLGGASLGAVIAIRMLEKIKKEPAKLVLFQGIYDGDLLKPEKLYHLIIKIAFKFGPYHPFPRKLLNYFLKNEQLLYWVYRFNYRGRPDIEKIIRHQIEQTVSMNGGVWLEIIYDLFNLHLGEENLKYDIPTLLVFSEFDNILDTKNTVSGLKSIFSKSRLISIDLQEHAPSLPMTKDFVAEKISPLMLHLKE